MRNVTLCLLLKDEHINLGYTKRGFSLGKYNGYGGKQEPGETISQAAIRELGKESEVEAKESDLTKVGEITFIFPHDTSWNQLMHVYKLFEWQGTPKETEEMSPARFKTAQMPYDRMWEADRIWFPPVLEGKHVEGLFMYSPKGKIIKKHLEVFSNRNWG